MKKYFSLRGGLLSVAMLAFALGTTSLQAADLRLATTTSTENSGLLSQLLPKFEARHGIKVRVVAVGTGAALKLGENGDADVVLVHAREAEDAFVAAGFGVNRRDVMYNDFVIVAPASDKAGVRGMKDLSAALTKIREAKVPFISRGDDSGTHKMEIKLWAQAGGTPQGTHYFSIGQSMGNTLSFASEKQGYTLTDRATHAAMRTKTNLEIVVEGDPRLLNPYGIIAVNPARHRHVNAVAAMKLIDWFVSPEGRHEIAAFKPQGEQLFFLSVQSAHLAPHPLSNIK